MSKLQQLKYLLDTSASTLFLTGAGISTASGIPDYRGPQGVYVRNESYKPITYQEFIGSHERRQRYWVRSMLGYAQFHQALPNLGHSLIARYLDAKPASGVITQNVDGLHVKAGSTRSIEMHGSLSSVVCQSCGTVSDRHRFQDSLALLNRKIYDWVQRNPTAIQADVSSSVNPDGDVEVTWDYSEFVYPSCSSCRVGTLKPNVVFFGENIPEATKQKTFDAVDRADVLVVVGSSLMVYSALRLVKRAHEQKKPIVIINLGKTRGDELASLTFNDDINRILQGVLL
ncbi:NAD-dependent protein lipoamidase sirtuin-4 [Kappamyces sp. JEL0829]|nr:NAD-dependent protein lipoamidase sirtuin-4 [Kappamyces sp. JEL0829]KAJ3337638.1 NAD-dependent protein lipoamidase sirtuin-4 [Kappamyces sp. JEL0680]